MSNEFELQVSYPCRRMVEVELLMDTATSVNVDSNSGNGKRPPHFGKLDQ